MTCDPDIIANPSEVEDFGIDGVPGKILYWSCCGKSWYLSPSTKAATRHCYPALHLAAGLTKNNLQAT